MIYISQSLSVHIGCCRGCTAVAAAAAAVDVFAAAAAVAVFAAAAAAAVFVDAHYVFTSVVSAASRSIEYFPGCPCKYVSDKDNLPLSLLSVAFLASEREVVQTYPSHAGNTCCSILTKPNSPVLGFVLHGLCLSGLVHL